MWYLAVLIVGWILYTKRPTRLCIILGSGQSLNLGGHSSEMMRLIQTIQLDKVPLLVLYAAGDPTALVLLNQINFKDQQAIPRARSVGQSWWTTPWTFLYSLLACVWIALRYDIRMVIPFI